MKAKLILESDGDEAVLDLLRAALGKKWESAMLLFQQESLRRRWKYGDDDREIEIAEKIQDEFFEVLRTSGLDIDYD